MSGMVEMLPWWNNNVTRMTHFYMIRYISFNEYGFLCFREAKQSAPRKLSHGATLMSITEREEPECQKSLEPDVAECTSNSPNNTDQKEVHRITACLVTLLI